MSERRDRKTRVPPRKRGAPPQRPVSPTRSRDEQVLRERIQKFTYQNRFKSDFESAIRLYFGEDALQNNTLSVDESGIPGFQEWYIHDYVTFEGKRIIDLFADEKGQRLPTAQRQMLDDWRRTNRSRLLEVQAVEPGVGITVQDLLGDEVFTVNDISSSHVLTRWQVLLMRPLLTEGRLCFAGSGLRFPPNAKSDLLDFARQLREAYQVQHPQASLDDFYRDHSLDLYRTALEIGTAPPPPVYTMEGHPFVASEARYTVTDARTVERRLDQAEEFFGVGPADEDETALAYVWLLAGRSHVPEAPIKGQGMVMQSSFVAEGDEIPFRSLGDVRLWQYRLELSCTSRERLAAGKALLEEMLGDLIRHLSDEYQDVEALLQSTEPAPPRRRGRLSREQKELAHQMMVEHYRTWLDESIPALGGATPRQAAQDPAMREQLEELLKSVEYTEERRRREGEPYVDVADIRRNLGLPPR